jgi:hypothetical protein
MPHTTPRPAMTDPDALLLFVTEPQQLDAVFEYGTETLTVDSIRVAAPAFTSCDPEVWATEYGVTGAAAIREDVRSKVRHDLRTHLVDDLGVASEVYVAASSYRPASIPGLR